MKLVGKVELKTAEFPDALEFTVSREDGAAERIVFPIFALIVLVWFWWIGSLWPRILAGFAAISTAAAYLANWIQGGKTTLRITSDGIAADGNLGKLFSTHEQIAMRDISSIRYVPADEGAIGGLYARRGWHSVPLLPQLSVDQANSVIDAILRKFPHIPAETYSAASLSDLTLFDRSDQITTLGLSDSGKSETDRDGEAR